MEKTIGMNVRGLNFDEAVNYHYGKFPPASLQYERLVKPLSKAAAALARYEQLLRGMHNSSLLLAPLRSQEALVSSRMEGTITTLDELLRYEANKLSMEEAGIEIDTPARQETIEVFAYQVAMRHAQHSITEGQPLSAWFIRSIHRELCQFTRGAEKKPGEYKTEQNYLADPGKQKILFIPVAPDQLIDGMETLLNYGEFADEETLLKVAISHVEFEALHPFNDGNGRVGRMLITLMLWKYGIISAPHFYVSGYFEKEKDEYIDRMRAVSEKMEWTEWCIFFLTALTEQAQRNIEVAESIAALYEGMKGIFRELLSSQWSTLALDFVFGSPVFRNNRFTSRSGIPRPTAARFTRVLSSSGLLTTLEESSGRRPAMYAFEPLLALLRA